MLPLVINNQSFIPSDSYLQVVTIKSSSIIHNHFYPSLIPLHFCSSLKNPHYSLEEDEINAKVNIVYQEKFLCTIPIASKTILSESSQLNSQNELEISTKMKENSFIINENDQKNLQEENSQIIDIQDISTPTVTTEENIKFLQKILNDDQVNEIIKDDNFLENLLKYIDSSNIDDLSDSFRKNFSQIDISNLNLKEFLLIDKHQICWKLFNEKQLDQYFTYRKSFCSLDYNQINELKNINNIKTHITQCTAISVENKDNSLIIKENSQRKDSQIIDIQNILTSDIKEEKPEPININPKEIVSKNSERNINNQYASKIIEFSQKILNDDQVNEIIKNYNFLESLLIYIDGFFDVNDLPDFLCMNIKSINMDNLDWNRRSLFVHYKKIWILLTHHQIASINRQAIKKPIS